MNCAECKEKLVEYIEGLLGQAQEQQLLSHMESCHQCRMEFDQLAALGQRITADVENRQLTDLETSVFNRIMCEQNKKLKQADGTHHRLQIWRFLMKAPIKFTAAAVILIAATLSLTLFDTTVPKAYALEETIEAMRQARVVHMFCRDWDDDPLELWMKLNPETRLPDYIYIDYPKHDAQILSTPYVSYQYVKEKKIFQFTSKQLMNFDIRLESIIEDVATQLTKASDDINIKIYSTKNPETGQNEITVLSEGESDSIEITINSETKLPTRINIIKASKMGTFIKNFDEIYFDEEPPAGVFEFKIPQDAIVINQDDVENLELEENPNIGLSMEGISRQEAADLLSDVYFQSLISQDFEQLKNIYPAFQLKLAEEVYKAIIADNLPVGLVETGELRQEYGCTDDPVITCIARHQDGTLKEYKLIIKFREIGDQTSAIITGLCGMPQEIEEGQ